MGPTGSGKSSVGTHSFLLTELTWNQFINIALGRNVAAVGHGLMSCTSDVRAFRCRNADGNDRNIVLVDTPGFDGTDRQDTEVLESIATWSENVPIISQSLSAL
jgi:predicted GTPase